LIPIPHIKSIHVGLDWADDYESLCHKLILQHKWSQKIYKTGRQVFEIAPNNIRLFEPLFDIIQNEVVKTFPKIKIGDRKSWAYVSNSERYQYSFHRHTTISIKRNISTVYYLKKSEGGISFDVDGKKYVHDPKEGELLIFPAVYLHSPLPLNSKEYRISLNVNFDTENYYIDFLDR
tara:strand:+ start:668 stop:1198 length:531 start_codon:yes stop_codon:yes gene_type:complete